MENKQIQIKLVTSAIIGNILEWYDFSLYGYFATILATHFFPAHNQALSYIQTFAVFAGGFLMRPLGGVIFGHFGDRFGRKKALAFSVMLMAIPTTIVGLLPTYSSIGIWAGILLALCRCLQGLAGGGEFSGSIVYLVEHAPEKHRTLYGSFALFGGSAGFLLASGISAITTTLMNHTTHTELVWRLPFLIGIVLGFIGLYLRLRMPETPTFTKLFANQQILRYPLFHLIKNNLLPILTGILLTLLPAAGFYLLFVYLSSYIPLYLKLSLHLTLIANTIGIALVITSYLTFGYLADRFGKKIFMLIGTISMIILAYPLFHLLLHATFLTTLIVQIIFAILVACSYAPVPAALAELFHADIRYSGVAFAQNTATIFAGFVPLIATILIHSTGWITIPSVILIVSGILTLLSVVYFKERKQ